MDMRLEKINLLMEQHQQFLKGKGYSLETLRAYGLYLRAFFTYSKKEGIEDLKEIDRGWIARYQTHLLSAPKSLSLSTQQSNLISLRSFFKFLERENIILYDPTSQIELPKKAETLPRDIFSEKEIKKLLGVVNIEARLGPRDRAILELFYSTGIRSMELTMLDIYDVDRERGMLRVRQGKGKKWRVIPIGELAMHYLENYMDRSRVNLINENTEQALFVNYAGRRIHKGSIPKIVQKHARRAGIKRRVCAHMIRHTMAAHMLRRRAPIRYIQEILGHASLETTQIYTRVEISDLKKIHQRTHPRERV